jgi:hypothetical protein
MDADQFDSLTVSLVRASRRQALRLVVAGVDIAALARFRSPSTLAASHRCNGAKCTGHELCCPVFDCSGAMCVSTPGCVDVRSNPFHCGSCEQVCDDACCHGECCFSSSGQGQVCLPTAVGARTID